jgi:hypothetical protein
VIKQISWNFGKDALKFQEIDEMHENQETSQAL